MAAYNKFNVFVGNLVGNILELNTDTYKVMLTDVAPVSTNTVYANLTDLATANGYTAGGTAVTGTSYSQTGGVATLACGAVVVITASGGTIGPFRYAVIYDSTASGGPLLGWWDYGSPVTLNSGDTFTVGLNTSTGILTIQ